MFCCWNGNLLAVEEKTSLYELRFQDKKEWILKRRCVLPSKFDCCNVMKIVLNSRLGFHVPMILATCYTTSASQLRTKLYHILLYDVNADGDGIFPSFGFFDVPRPHTPSESNGFILLNGPTVVWSEECMPILHVVHGVNDVRKMSHNTIDVQEYVKDHAVKCIDKLWVLDWDNDTFVEDQCGMFILFLRLILDEDDNSGSCVFKWICLLVKTVHASHGGYTVQTLPASSFIPCEYGYIATCVTLRENFTVNVSCGDIAKKNQFIVGTCCNQVVVFEEGVLLHCITACSIPQSIVAIQTVLDYVIIAAHLQTGGVFTCKINKTVFESNHSTWQGVSNIVAGDFAGLGHDQLLLCLDSGMEDHNIVVTDFCQFTSEVMTEASNSHKPCPESLLNTVKALELQKHSREAYLIDKEREMQRKAQLFEFSIQLLSSLGCGKGELDTSIKSDPSLVCIIPGDGEMNKASNSTTLSNPIPIKITSLWQRLIDEHWTVGMIVKNTSTEAINSLWFSLVTSGTSWEQLDSVCKIIPIKHTGQCSDTNTSTSIKKPRLDEEPITEKKLLDVLWSDNGHMECKELFPEREVCVVLSLPLSASFVYERETTVHVIGCWKLNPDCGTPVMLSVRGLKSTQISLDQVKFGSNEKCMLLWEGRMEVIMKDDTKAFQDLACVLGTTTMVQIRVQSTYTNLLRLPSILKAKISFLSHVPKPVMQTSSQEDLFLSSGGAEMIGDGLVFLVSSDSSSASFVILYKSVAQLTTFLAILKHYLSEDVSFSLGGKTHRENTLVQSLTHIRCEVEKKYY